MNFTLFRKELYLTTQLALPLIAALLTQIAMEIVNTIMLGRLGPKALAGGVLGIALFFILLVVCIGLFSASGVMIARSYGAGNSKEVSDTLSQSLYLAIFLSVPCMVLLWNTKLILLTIKEQPEIVELSSQFIRALLWGFPPLLVFFALREFVSALSFPKIILVLSLIATPLTAIGNYVFMYGKLGLPALGIAGIGYSTSFIEWLMVIAMFIYIFRNKILSQYLKFSYLKFHWKKFIEMIKLGIPVSFAMGFEVGLFSVTSLLMGYVGTNALAAHQIVLQCATFAFMIPLGISQATAVRVGHSIGQGSYQQAKYAGFIGVGLGVAISLIMAIGFFIFPHVLIRLFLDMSKANPDLISLAVSFFGVMALFQIFDAIQVIMSGALRGLKDTFVLMWLGLLSYWLAGLSSGYYLAFVLNYGGLGLWCGLGIGIAVSGILLLLRFYIKIHHEEAHHLKYQI